MNGVRTELQTGVGITCFCDSGIDRGYWSVRFFLAADGQEDTAIALLPYVLRSGTVYTTEPADVERLLAELDAAVKPKAEVLGHVRSVGFDAVFGSRASLEQQVGVLMDFILHPATKNGRLRGDYIETEKQNAVQRIEAEKKDHRFDAASSAIEMLGGDPSVLCAYGKAEQLEKVDVGHLFRSYQKLLDTAMVEILYCGSELPQRVVQKTKRALMDLPQNRRELSWDNELFQHGLRTVEHRKRDNEEIPETVMVFNLAFDITDGLYPVLLVIMELLENVEIDFDAPHGLLLLREKPENGADGVILRRLEELQSGGFSEEQFREARNRAADKVYNLAFDFQRLNRMWLDSCAEGEELMPDLLAGAIENVRMGQVAAAALELELCTITDYGTGSRETEPETGGLLHESN